MGKFNISLILVVSIVNLICQLATFLIVLYLPVWQAFQVGKQAVNQQLEFFGIQNL
jgi:hypothetical protein